MEKKIYWETNTPCNESDYTVFKTFDEAQEAIYEYIGQIIEDTDMKELEADGIKLHLYIKPIRLTDEQFKNMLEEV